MKKIVVRHIESGSDKREYTLLTTVEEIDEHINLEIGCADALDIIRERKHNYRPWKKDSVGLLMDMYQGLNEEQVHTLKIGNYGSITFCGFYDKAALTRTDLLNQKREQMVEVLKKYGQIWLNDNGSYCPPLKGYEIIKRDV